MQVVLYFHHTADPNSSLRLSRKSNRAPILHGTEREFAMIIFISLVVLLFVAISIAPLLIANADPEASILLPE
jgi:hypothetical protein